MCPNRPAAATEPEKRFGSAHCSGKSGRCPYAFYELSAEVVTAHLDYIFSSVYTELVAYMPEVVSKGVV